MFNDHPCLRWEIHVLWKCHLIDEPVAVIMPLHESSTWTHHTLHAFSIKTWMKKWQLGKRDNECMHILSSFSYAILRNGLWVRTPFSSGCCHHLSFQMDSVCRVYVIFDTASNDDLDLYSIHTRFFQILNRSVACTEPPYFLINSHSCIASYQTHTDQIRHLPSKK